MNIIDRENIILNVKYLIDRNLPIIDKYLLEISVMQRAFFYSIAVFSNHTI